MIVKMIENIIVGQLCKDGDVILPQPDNTYEYYDKTNLLAYHKHDSESPFKVPVLKIQEGGSGGNVWLILNSEDDKKKSIQELFSNLLEGKFLIGFSNYFVNPYIITDISRFNNEENIEIKLHYTEPRTYTDKNGDKINNSWRTITWDLFDKSVNKN